MNERIERVVAIIRDNAKKYRPGTPENEMDADLEKSVTAFCQRFSSFHSDEELAHLYVAWPDMEDA